MWAIWNFRNNWTHDNGSFNPAQSVKIAKEALAVLQIPKKIALSLPSHGWRQPYGNAIKINIAGGFSCEARRGGVGGVARLSSSYLRARSKPYLSISDPLIAEALALRDGVMFVNLRGYYDVVMETDSL
jgi:hypothetical protein